MAHGHFVASALVGPTRPIRAARSLGPATPLNGMATEIGATAKPKAPAAESPAVMDQAVMDQAEMDQAEMDQAAMDEAVLSKPNKRIALPFKMPGITSGLKPATSKSFIQRSGVISG